MRWLLASVFLCLYSFVWAQGFTIRRFNADLALEKSGKLRVTETIDVHFDESKHGIYRTIPTALDNGKGSSRSIFVSNIDCSDPAKITSSGGKLNIRLGQAKVELPAGTDHTYTISYSVENAINWFDKDERWQPFCELYWNVTGNEWQSTIGSCAVTVTYPGVGSGRDVRARVFAGAYGSRANVTLESAGSADDPSSLTQMQLSTTHLQVERASMLSYGEGLTIVLDLPQGTLAKPSTWDQVRWFLLPNLGFVLPLFALLFGWIGYRIYGKDPASGPIVVSYDPPDDISGPEAGAFIDEKVDQRDIASGIVSLAVKGYLTIEPAETGMVFKRSTANLRLTSKSPGGDLTPFEAKLYALLASAGPLITDADLRSEVAPSLMSLKSSLYDSLVRRGYYTSSPQTARVVFGLGLVLILLLVAFVLTIASPLHSPIPAIIGGVISLPVVAYYIIQAPRRTAEGARAWARVKGFEDFVRRARGSEMEWVSQKHPDQALFELYLPHAIAFGLTAQWARMFEGVTLETPRWYVSPYGGPFHPMYFANDMNTISSSIGQAASTPPRSSGASGGSSGFGGGGFSGGGFGGGGGGSW